MRFLIDVDGVVADIVPYLFHSRGGLENKFPGKIPRITEIKSDIFSPEESPLPSEVLEYTLKWVSTPGFANDLPVLENAVESITKIREAGHDIYWVTAPWHSSKTWDFDRRKWIMDHFGDDHNKVIFCHAKHVCSGDVFIDDRVKNIRNWQESHPQGRALLYDQPWNAGYDNFEKFTWNDIGVLLKSLQNQD